MSFGDFTALRDVSMSIAAGEVHCIVGPNGAGKTTLFNVICGDHPPTAGRIRLGERYVEHDSVARRVRSGMGRTFQTPRLVNCCSVYENVRLSAQAHYFGPFRRAHPFRRRDHRTLVSAVEQSLHGAGLADRAGDAANSLSHGERAWLQLAMVLVRAPSILLLDEPTAGMSEAGLNNLAGTLAALKGTRTLVLIEHDIGFVKRVADRITVLDGGRIAGSGTVAEIEKDAHVASAYLGGPA
jgi:ABC-type uncharacterized transport system ATPase subunit